MDFLSILGLIFLGLIIITLLGLLFGNDTSEAQKKLESDIIKKYKETLEYKEEVTKEAEKLFQQMKTDFLKKQLENDYAIEQETVLHSSIEMPKYDFSDVKFLHEIEPSISKEELIEVIETKDRKKIDRKYLFPKKDVEDTSSEFYKKKVVISGIFEHFEMRNDIAKILYDLGADIDTSVTERTDYLIKGENCGWSKEEKAIRFGCIICTEAEFLEKIKK
ncbi:BRCT domain-containing protein [Bergeyella zoohelcum]|uniref:BRCT domain-containing protein n=1 Tax=Bergeyella zoohelcum TaxID=1015 RepID=UPI003735C1DE